MPERISIVFNGVQNSPVLHKGPVLPLFDPKDGFRERVSILVEPRIFEESIISGENWVMRLPVIDSSRRHFCVVIR